MNFYGFPVVGPSSTPGFYYFRTRVLDRRSKRWKYRPVAKPNDAMRDLQTELKFYVRALGYYMPFSTGGWPRGNVVRHITPHRQSQHFYELDLKSAFHSINSCALAMLLLGLDPSIPMSVAELEQWLDRYCMRRQGGLVQGGPASQDLFNLYCAFYLDNALSVLCESWGVAYTRYIDDLLFSHPSREIGIARRRAIRRLVLASGFRINDQKTRVHVLRPGGSIELNGVGLRYGGHVFIPRWYLRYVRGLIQCYLDGDETVTVKRVMGCMSHIWTVTRKTTAWQKRVVEKFIIDYYIPFCREAGRRGEDPHQPQ